MLSDAERVLDIKLKLFSRAECDRLLSLRSLTQDNIGTYLCHLFRGLGKGYAYLFMLDRRRRLMGKVCLKRDGRETFDSTFEKVNASVEAYEPAFIAVAHNHKGELAPSYADLNTTHLLSERYGESFLGHYIVSGLDYLLIEPSGATIHRKYD